MSPTINHGDKVFISSFAEDEEIYNSIIYLVIYNGRTYIKRIQINPVDGKIRLVSDNEKYETFEIPLNKQKDLKIVGRVIFKCTFEDVI
jgi:phage repressor protein C with HTH and peptisase S24 domain